MVVAVVVVELVTAVVAGVVGVVVFVCGLHFGRSSFSWIYREILGIRAELISYKISDLSIIFSEFQVHFLFSNTEYNAVNSVQCTFIH